MQDNDLFTSWRVVNTFTFEGVHKNVDQLTSLFALYSAFHTDVPFSALEAAFNQEINFKFQTCFHL